MFLCSLTDPITILIRFIAFASIGKIDNFYAAALPSEHKLKREPAELEIKNHRFVAEADESDFAKKKDKTCGNRTARIIYKSFRLIYTSFIFYFLPYMALFIPQFCSQAA